MTWIYLLLCVFLKYNKGAYSIANISWIERKVAAAIFGTPPQATYHDALDYFMRAERVSPGFWKKNQLMIAQCHMSLGDKAKAKTWLLTAKTIPCNTEEDQVAENEIEKLLLKV